MRSRLWPVLTVVLAALVVWGTFARARKESEVRAWQRQAALNDSLHQIEAGRYQRAAVAIERERDLRRVLQDSLPDLYRELRDLRADTRDYIHTIAQLQDLVAEGSATDTVYVSPATGDTIHRVDFEHTQPGIRIQGFTITPPPRYQLRAHFEPIPLHIIVSQLRDGSFQANVETAPWVEISALDTRVVQRPKSWLRRNHPWIASIGLLVVWEWIR